MSLYEKKLNFLLIVKVFHNLRLIIFHFWSIYSRFNNDCGFEQLYQVLKLAAHAHGVEKYTWFALQMVLKNYYGNYNKNSSAPFVH